MRIEPLALTFLLINCQGRPKALLAGERSSPADSGFGVRECGLLPRNSVEKIMGGFIFELLGSDTRNSPARGAGGPERWVSRDL